LWEFGGIHAQEVQKNSIYATPDAKNNEGYRDEEELVVYILKSQPETVGVVNWCCFLQLYIQRK